MGATMSELTEKLSEWVNKTSFKDLPQGDVRTAKNAIIDYGKNMGKAFSDAYNKEMSKNVGKGTEEKLTTDFSK